MEQNVELSPQDQKIENILSEKQKYIQQMEKDLKEQERINQEMLDQIKSEPSLIQPKKVVEHTPNWRKKKVRKIQVKEEVEKEEDILEEVEKKQMQQNLEQNIKVQENLKKNGDMIPVATNRQLNVEEYEQYFKYLIYDGYRPQNLAHCRDYIDFLTRDNLENDDTPQHILDYLKNEIKTKLPHNVEEDYVLDFDQNFEGGNLDSVYLVSEYEYNLVMKVDTNTKGNTYWFMFKVAEFQQGAKYKFNIMNFTRNLEKFYSSGLNICTKKDTKDGVWQYHECENVTFTEKSDIARILRKNPETGEIQYARYFSKLSFSYTFKEADSVVFAYSVPYGYTDLVRDLDEMKEILLKDEAFDEYIPLDVNLENAASDEESSPMPRLSQAIQGGQGDQIAKKQAKSPDPKERGQGQKLSQYEMQHLQIKKQAVNEMQVNRFESKYIKSEEQTNYEKEFQLDPQKITKNQNFDIYTRNIHYRQEVLGQSICGLNIYQISITKRKELSMKYKKKKIIYIQARLHAAETHGSLIMQNIMLEFATNYDKYDKLLNTFIVKLVPMINPDGVVIGNSRCSLAGLDLNRRWSEPNPILHPEIYYLKTNMAMSEGQSGGISIFCDLHGHNKQMNAFIYGCNKAPNEGLLSWTKTRLLPKILASIEPIFEFNKCIFSQEKFKYNTARVVVWNEFRVINSFTLETSMYGKKTKITQGERIKTKTSQLTLDDFKSIGLSILSSFLQYVDLEIELEKEFKATGGWLKKKKLDQMTGETARAKHEQNTLIQVQTSKISSKKPLSLKKSQINIYPTETNEPKSATVAVQNKILELKQKKSEVNKNPKEKSKQNKRKPTRNSTTKNLYDDSILKDEKDEKDEKLNETNYSVQEDELQTKPEKNIEEKTEENDDEKHDDDEKPQPRLKWNDFFVGNEFTDALKESQKPIIKSKLPQKPCESDSEPSCDNFDEVDLVERFEAAATEEVKLPKQKPKQDIELIKKYMEDQKKIQQPQPKMEVKPEELTLEKIDENMNRMQKQNQKLSMRMEALTQQITAKIMQDQVKKQFTTLDQQNTYSYPNDFSRSPIVNQNRSNAGIFSLDRSFQPPILKNLSYKNNQITLPKLKNQKYESSTNFEKLNYNPQINTQQLKETKAKLFDSLHVRQCGASDDYSQDATEDLVNQYDNFSEFENLKKPRLSRPQNYSHIISQTPSVKATHQKISPDKKQEMSYIINKHKIPLHLDDQISSVQTNTRDPIFDDAFQPRNLNQRVVRTRDHLMSQDNDYIYSKNESPGKYHSNYQVSRLNQSMVKNVPTHITLPPAIKTHPVSVNVSMSPSKIDEFKLPSVKRNYQNM